LSVLIRVLEASEEPGSLKAMPIWPDAAEEELDATGGLDPGLVAVALAKEVRSIAVQDVHVLLLDVHLGCFLILLILVLGVPSGSLLLKTCFFVL